MNQDLIRNPIHITKTMKIKNKQLQKFIDDHLIDLDEDFIKWMKKYHFKRTKPHIEKNWQLYLTYLNNIYFKN